MIVTMIKKLKKVKVRVKKKRKKHQRLVRVWNSKPHQEAKNYHQIPINKIFRQPLLFKNQLLKLISHHKII
jgi:cell fate (sporulation/competence/biofilm development) regulator YmcA (YheA/YmcA/DUF963 family)